MATTTTNLGLTKPAYSDTADIADINGNFDALDTMAGNLFTTNIGNTATASIAKDKQIYVRGHSTLAEGLYKAKAAIASGETLSSSNLEAADALVDQIGRLMTIDIYTDCTTDMYGSVYHNGQQIRILKTEADYIVTCASYNNAASSLPTYPRPSSTDVYIGSAVPNLSNVRLEILKIKLN